MPSLALLALLAACKGPGGPGGQSEDGDSDGFLASEGDCDDADPAVNPVAEEICDGKDNDCDTRIDEDVIPRWFVDLDGDGYGGVSDTLSACTEPEGYVGNATDCDDTSARIHPGAEESECADPIDYNCDGSVEYADGDADGFVACEECDDSSASIHPGAIELCNGVDDDCDGTVDEPDVAPTWYEDADGDGYGWPGVSIVACDEPKGYVLDATDCDDTTAVISPGADELCNEIDDDCDEEVDEHAVDEPPWYPDADGDGFGVRTPSVRACSVPDGYVADAYDCDDTRADITWCQCELTGIGAMTLLDDENPLGGAWVVDPIETLGEGLVWDMPEGWSSVVYEYANQAAMLADSPSRTIRLPSSRGGTGAAVYNGYLYYHAVETPEVVRYDLTTGETAFLELPISADIPTRGYYCAGAYSTVDLAVDEHGLWVIYTVEGGDERLTISKIDERSFTLSDTWETDSPLIRWVGNAWMTCGVLYTTNDCREERTTTVSYAFDTQSGRTWNPDIPISVGFVSSSLNYSPYDGLLRAWDTMSHVTYTTTIE